MLTRSASTLRRLRGVGVVRDPGEEHRASTPLELLFDLTFVVAVNRAVAGLHHELGAGHVAVGLVGFSAAFFAIWWAWMNFTWFASAHDSDDVAHRLLTFVQMLGVLVMAAGGPRALEDGDYALATAGYLIMRLGLVAAWLRVARDQPWMRRRALRFALGISVLQALWVARLVLDAPFDAAGFAVLVAGEMLLPVWAERVNGQRLFHPGHIEERYGLFTVIMLGESILSASIGFQSALEARGATPALLGVGLGGLVLAFASWWLYFDHPGHLAPSPAHGFRWGYGHVILFASLAAAGAGIGLAADAVGDHGNERVAALAVAVPVAGYLLGLALLMALTGRSLTASSLVTKVGGAVAALVLGLVAPVVITVVGCAVVLAFLVVLMVLVSPDRERPATVDAVVISERLRVTGETSVT